MRSRELSRSAGNVRLPSFAMHWGCFAKRHFLILYFLVIAQWLTFPKSDNGSRQNPNTNTWQSFWDLHLGGVPYTSSISIKLCINRGHCCRRFTGSPESSLANRFSNQDGMPYPKSPQRTPPRPDSQGRTVWNVEVSLFLVVKMGIGIIISIYLLGPFGKLPLEAWQALNEAKVPIIIPMPEGTFQRPQDDPHHPAST